MLTTSYLVVLGLIVGVASLSWAYFRAYELERPSVGVTNLEDVAFMMGAIILIPYLYLALPLWLVAAVFALAMLGILYFTAQPVLVNRWAVWLVALSLLGADVGTNLYLGPTSAAFSLVNDAVLVLAVVGVTTLWAQSGMKASDVAVLAGALTFYDLVATSFLPLMNDLIWRLASIPFAPVIAWGAEPDRVVVGLGDLLLVGVFPLVMRKAFGRSAGIAGVAINLGTLIATMTILQLANVRATVPLMTVLGPLMVLQYAYWRRRRRERTTRQYLRAEPPKRLRTVTLTGTSGK
jgi:hypothetical protein